VQAEYLDEVDGIGDTAYWVEGVAPSKVTDFAGEAAAQDVDTLSRYGDAKGLALVACLAHIARMRARDDLAEMLCKRVSSIVKRAKTELEEIRLRQRAVSEKLIGTYRTVLESLDPEAEEPGEGPARAVAAVEEAGGFAAQLADIEEVSAYHGDNYEVLVHRFFRMDRATMFDLAGKDAADSGIAFASGNWRRAVTATGDRRLSPGESGVSRKRSACRHMYIRLCITPRAPMPDFIVTLPRLFLRLHSATGWPRSRECSRSGPCGTRIRLTRCRKGGRHAGYRPASVCWAAS
jgi:hypothetical protein